MIIVVYKGQVRGDDPDDNHTQIVYNKTFEQVVKEVEKSKGYWNREEVEILEVEVKQRHSYKIPQSKQVLKVS